MNFSNPLFLYGLFALLIPVIIHLFNFRRYKTAYFSNVKMLQDILEKTKKESQLQHLIVLLLRILGISALVFAFAQPYIPVDSNENRGGNVVTIFVDNSFSMNANSEGSSLLYEAVSAAKNLVNAFSYADDFVLVTHDFKAEESHLLNKDEILNLLDEIQISSKSKSMTDIVAFAQNVASYSKKENKIHYYISDFQKKNIDFSQLAFKENEKAFLIPLPAEETNNIAIDTCWFNSPIFKTGQQVTLSVRVYNYGKTDIQKVPVKLFVNQQQKSIATLDIKAGSYANCQMNYTIASPGIQYALLQIEDSPITFDDKLYFVYEVAEATDVIAVVDKNDNKYLNALYGKDSLFTYTVMNVNEVNYSKFRDAKLIVLNELKSISSGLADELQKFVNSGGNLLLFPAKDLDMATWNEFLNEMGCSFYVKLVDVPVKVGKVNVESEYFKGSFSEVPTNLNMPLVTRYFDISQNSTIPSEKIMQLENGAPLLSSFKLGKGKVLLSSVALNDDFGDAHKHALMFVPVHNFSILSSMVHSLYNIIGKDEFQTVNAKKTGNETVFVLKNQRSGEEMIPEQRNAGNETILYFHSQIQEAGFYDVYDGKLKVGALAFNLDRKESDLSYYSRKELKEIAENAGFSLDVLDGSSKNLTKQISDSLNGVHLWRYFIFFALLCFLGEILILRFWGRAKVREKK